MNFWFGSSRSHIHRNSEPLANHIGFYEKTYTFNSNVDGQSISTDACNLVIRIPQTKSPNLLKNAKIDILVIIREVTYVSVILTSRSHMLDAEEIDEVSLRLIDDRRVGVIIVDTARFRGDGTPLIVIALLSRLPNLTVHNRIITKKTFNSKRIHKSFCKFYLNYQRDLSNHLIRSI